MTSSSSNNLIASPEAILDELHIMSEDNKDVNGNSTITEILTHDYWGRPMTSPSSHKSYRPFTILTFRYSQQFGQIFGWSQLFTHRFINVLLHGALVEMVVRLSTTLLFFFLTRNRQQRQSTSLSKYTNNETQQVTVKILSLITRLLFALHPTHVEAVVNIANRAHLLSLLFVVLQLDLNMNIGLLGIVHICGLTSCETALFTLPAIIFTWIWIWMEWYPYFDSSRSSLSEYDLLTLELEEEDSTKKIHSNKDKKKSSGKGTRIRMKQGPSVTNTSGKKKNDSDSTDSYQSHYTNERILQAIQQLSPRIILVSTLSISYVALRHYNDWISIPDGLIRPAENPYYSFMGMTRVLNYAYIISIHISKSVGVGLTDWVGFSHEYGYDCIPQIEGWSDDRLLIPLGIAITFFCIGWKCILLGLREIILFIVGCCWVLATLFPISGIVKVGTFIADRIVIASSVGSSILWGYLLTCWIAPEYNDNIQKKSKIKNLGKYFVCFIWLSILSIKVHTRSKEWMDSKSLLHSSLYACPRSAKSNLEISKLYSGLDPDKVDLALALDYIEKAEKNSPEYCDVHFQYAHVLIQQHKYLEFEDRITKGVLCPFTMYNSYSLMKRYWTSVLQDPRQGNDDAKKRYQKYNKIIEDAIRKEEKAQQDQDRSTSEKKISSDEL